MSPPRPSSAPPRPPAPSQPAGWPQIDAQLAHIEAQLMELARIRAIGTQKLRRVTFHTRWLARGGRPCPPAMARRRRRYARALDDLAFAEMVITIRHRRRLAELGFTRY